MREDGLLKVIHMSTCLKSDKTSLHGHIQETSCFKHLKTPIFFTEPFLLPLLVRLRLKIGFENI